jgi:drug/metabolite transporter (DMT)-like permease
LVLEREPLKYSDLPAMTKEWVQVAGGFAAVGLLIYILYSLFARRPPGGTRENHLPWWFTAALLFGALAALCYIPAIGISAYQSMTEKPGPDVTNIRQESGSA